MKGIISKHLFLSSILFMVAFLLNGPVLGQTSSLPFKHRLEIGAGFLWSSTAQQMFNHMESNGFNHDVGGEYPVYETKTKLGVSIGYYYKVDDRSFLGLKMGYSDLGGVVGNPGSIPIIEYAYSSRDILVPEDNMPFQVVFSSINMGLIYRYKVSGSFSLEAGPTLVRNRAIGSWGPMKTPIMGDFTIITPAAHVGLCLGILNGESEFLQANIHGLIIPKSSIREFEAPTIDNPQNHIPESNIGFSQLNLQLVYGFGLLPAPKKPNENFKIYMQLGLGWPDILHYSPALQFKQLKAGVTFSIYTNGETGGWIFNFPSFFYNKSVFAQYHFAGKSIKTNVKPWYIKMKRGAISEYLVTDLLTEKITMMPIRVGRELNLSPYAGFYLEAGVLWNKKQRRVIDEPYFTDWVSDWRNEGFTFEAGFFFRI